MQLITTALTIVLLAHLFGSLSDNKYNRFCFMGLVVAFICGTLGVMVVATDYFRGLGLIGLSSIMGMGIAAVFMLSIYWVITILRKLDMAGIL